MGKIKNKLYKNPKVITMLFIGFVFVFFNLNLQLTSSNCFIFLINDVQAEEEYLNTGDVDSDNFLLAPILAIFRLEGLLINLSVNLVGWALGPDINSILSNTGIYTGWSIVRDILNLFFIFFLLYSAFCTIFQISRYHIKSTWVMIVVMALLVNFSWPITRILIDMSNLAMMHLMGGGDMEQNMKQSNSMMASFGKESEFFKLMLGTENVKETDGFFSGKTTKVGGGSNFFLVLFFGIIVAFIFLVTFLTIALLLIGRIVVLAVLLIFASVGFTLAAFPSTRSYASQWWSSLTKQLIAGPVLLFCLLVAFVTLSGLQLTPPSEGNGISFTLTQQVLKFVITIALLWNGIIMSQKIGAEGSDMAFNFANKARNWGQNKLKSSAMGTMKFTGREMGHGINKGIANWGNKWSSADGAGKWAKFKKMTGTGINVTRSVPQRGKNWAEDRKNAYNDAIEESRARGLNVGGVGGDKSALKKVEDKNVAAMKKKWKDDNVSIGILAGKLKDSKGAEQRALIEHLVDQKDGVGESEISELVKKIDDPKLDVGLQKAISKKATETGNVHVLLRHHLSKSGADVKKIYNDNLANMTAQNMAKQEKFFTEIQTDQNLGKLGLDLQRRMSDASFKLEFLKQGANNKTVQAARAGNYV